MERSELIAALRRMKAETGSLVCLGCGYENGCSTRGCALIRAAADQIELDGRFNMSLWFNLADSLATIFGQTESQEVEEAVFELKDKLDLLFRKLEGGGT